MKECVFDGVATALVTPFTKDKEVDFEALGNLLEFQLSGDVDALVIFGTTGESSTLTDGEKNEILRFVKNFVGKKIPIIAGAGSNNTKRAIELSSVMANAGADALLHVTPYYNKTNSEGLFEHYKAIAENPDLPIILYNVPSRTGMDLTPETCGRLSEIPGIVGIKEASGDVRRVQQIHSFAGDDFTVYSGNDDVLLPVLACGGKGVISVLSNILPAAVSAMCKSFFDNEIAISRLLSDKFSKLTSLLFCETNPIPVKYALSLMGLCGEHTRLPLFTMSEKNKQPLKEELEKLGII